MKRKNIYIISILLLALIFIIIYINKLGVNIFDFSNLNLDQGNAYISISKNDITGYNRWLPFYFQLECNNNLTESEVENLLNKNVIRASLYSNRNGNLYETRRNHMERL